MPIVTAYATLDEFVGQLEANSSAPVDDVYIEALLERSSREFDGDTQHWFYAYPETRYYDLPRGRSLELDGPLLSVDSLTNGDATLLASTDYKLYPLNGLHKSEVRLLVSSGAVWQLGASGDVEGVVAITGSWGYVDRTATDPRSLVVISNTKTAVLALSLAVYRKRYGVSTDGPVTVTGAGVVITPREKSREYWALVSLYQRHT